MKIYACLLHYRAFNLPIRNFSSKITRLAGVGKLVSNPSFTAHFYCDYIPSSNLWRQSDWQVILGAGKLVIKTF